MVFTYFLFPHSFLEMQYSIFHLSSFNEIKEMAGDSFNSASHWFTVFSLGYH
jgi:hypothetical protein